MKTEKRRLLLVVPATILLCSVLGGVFGSRVVVASAASEGDVADSIKRFTDVLAVVEANYADEVDSEKAIFRRGDPESSPQA